jgi:hypothetical protein
MTLKFMYNFYEKLKNQYYFDFYDEKNLCHCEYSLIVFFLKWNFFIDCEHVFFFFFFYLSINKYSQ